MRDSNKAGGSGPGHIDQKRLQELVVQWGKLPPREREANILERTRDMDPRYREVIQEYFRRQSIQDSTKTP